MFISVYMVSVVVSKIGLNMIYYIYTVLTVLKLKIQQQEGCSEKSMVEVEGGGGQPEDKYFVFHLTNASVFNNR